MYESAVFFLTEPCKRKQNAGGDRNENRINRKEQIHHC